MTIPIERVRACWTRASSFPANKEEHYADHAKAHAFDKHKDRRVLEYGCGGGSDTLSYLRRGNFVHFVDIVAENVDVTRRRVDVAGYGLHATGLALEESDRIPVASGTFDVASAHGVIHHIESPLNTLKEISRVLKSHGLFYVMLYTEHLMVRHMPAIHALMRGRGLGWHEAFGWCTDGEGTPYSQAYSEAQGKELLRDAGFRPLDECIVYNRGDFRTFVAEAP
jgi:SAM-dependent methyltransferase